MTENAGEDTFDVVRIIASEARGLSSADRQTLRLAADELESALRSVIVLQAQVIETTQQRIAINDRLLDIMRTQSQPKVKSLITAKFGHWHYR